MGPLIGAVTSMFSTHPWVAVVALAGLILGAVVYSGSLTYAVIGAVVGGLVGYVIESVMKPKTPR